MRLEGDLRATEAQLTTRYSTWGDGQGPVRGGVVTVGLRGCEGVVSGVHAVALPSLLDATLLCTVNGHTQVVTPVSTVTMSPGNSPSNVACCCLPRPCRSRELSELRAHLAEEKGAQEGLRKEVTNADERAQKQVGWQASQRPSADRGIA
jgi:hypothetical protein